MTWKHHQSFDNVEADKRGEKTVSASAGGISRHTMYPDYWWDDQLWTALQAADHYVGAIGGISLDDPPDDATTRRELDEILKNPGRPDFESRISEIIEENEGPPAYYRRMLFLDQRRRPQTGVILTKVIGWSHPFIMYFKHKWKRPRPMQLEPRIRPVVDCPLHPAYPSGHSTQSHLFALVMKEVSGRTDIRDALWNAADRIAQNREYAGIHYESDSKAGARLAEQLLPLFVADEELKQLIDKARVQEWN
jgi:acid phosphatase (class A)